MSGVHSPDGRRREAKRRWQAERRATDSDLYARERKMVNALARAKTRLAGCHPDELLSLYNEERAVEGLPPVGLLPVGRPKSKGGPQ